MLRIIARTLRLFRPKERSLILLLMICMIVAAVFEVSSVASIMPFVALLTDPVAAQSNAVVASIAEVAGIETVIGLQLAAGGLTLSLLIFGNATLLLTQWLMLRVLYGHSHAMATDILGRYLEQPYEFWLQSNSSVLAKNLLSEVPRLTRSVIIPTLNVFARGTVVLLILVVLIVVDPVLAFASLGGLAVSYLSVYLFARRQLNHLGRASIAAEADRFRTATEALGSVKEVKVFGRENNFIDRFCDASFRRAVNDVSAETISVAPRYVVEVIAFGMIILIALYLLTSGSDQSAAIPTLALYAFAGYRLIPAMQAIYGGVTQVRYHGPVIGVIEEAFALPINQRVLHDNAMRFQCGIALERVSYRYPNGRPGLTNVDLAIEPMQSVGIVGASGAGKSTLADVLLGLLEPSAGRMLVDGTPLDGDAVGTWRRLVGYVPQQIVLLDDTIAANIAFGCAAGEINHDRLAAAVRLSQLEGFIASLPHRKDTNVGEKGVRLSGGQRQRIGLARALYNDPAVLIFDEATSALDNTTEAAVLTAVRTLKSQKTIIIIAHRLTTVANCDVIHLMRDGRIVASGNYHELLAGSAEFRTLVQHGHDDFDQISLRGS